VTSVKGSCPEPSRDFICCGQAAAASPAQVFPSEEGNNRGSRLELLRPGGGSFLGLLLLLLLASGPESASARPLQNGLTSRTEQNAGVIVITARRRAEIPEDVPLSVTALAGPELRRRGVENVEDLARFVPNLSLGAVGVLAAPQMSVRGVFSPVGAPTTGLYVDDVPIHVRPLGFSGNADVHMFDIERVEVLRGPQGSLFGAGSMGGAVRVLTRQPDLARWSASLFSQLSIVRGGDPGFAVEAVAGVPLIQDRAAVRLGAYRRREGGVVDREDRASGDLASRDLDDIETTAFKGIAAVSPLESLLVTASILHQRTNRDDLPLFESSRRFLRQGFQVDQPGRDTVLLPSLTAEATLGSVVATGTAAWLRREHRQTSDYSTIFGELVLGAEANGLSPPGGTRNHTVGVQHDSTVELRLASPPESRSARWTIGLFHQRSRLGLEQEVAEPGVEDLARNQLGGSIEDLFGAPLLTGGLTYSGRERLLERQIAGFGELSWHPHPRVELSAGARLTRSSLELNVTSEGLYAGPRIEVAESHSETAFSPRTALSFKPESSTLLYASASRGFRPGSANTPVPQAVCATDLAALGRSTAPSTYGSDGLWSYEIGAKRSPDHGPISVSGSVFQIDWSNIQQTVFLPGCGFSFIDNLGKARNRGFEAELGGALAQDLSFSAALGYVDARFMERLETSAISGSSEPSLIVDRGDRVPFVPRWSVALAGEYRGKFDQRASFYARLGLQYASAYQRTPAPPALGYDARVFEGDDVFNVDVRFGAVGETWEAAVFIRNLLDDRSILFSNADLVPASGQPLRQIAVRPRTIGIEASIRL
jgi:iron complex outermembrane recepter protein